MAVFKCGECGTVVEARCKPGKCKNCGAVKDKRNFFIAIYIVIL